MKKLILLVSLIVSLLAPVAAFAQANMEVPVCGIVTDGTTRYVPTDWTTFVAPVKGKSRG